MLQRLFDRLKGYERLRLRGDEHYLSGDFVRAGRFYARALAILPEDDPRRPTVEALSRDCAGRDATGGFRSLRTPEPKHEREDAYREGLDELFELAIAEKSDRRARSYRSLSPEFKRGYLALVQGDAETAVSELSLAATASEGSAVALMELGRAQSLAGELGPARRSLEAAERLAPEDGELAILLSAVDVELGRFDTALARLEDLRDDSAERSFLLGRALAGLRRSDEAVERFRETIRIEPQFHEAFFEASRVVGASGDREAQFGLLSRACALAPDEVRYNRELASLVIRESLDEEAGLAACDRLMVTDEENAWQYLFWIAELYIRRGWTREARDPLTKSLGLVPADRLAERHQIESRLRSIGRE